ncbi:MAG: hypothetical protein KJ645_00600, partial [Planctomycetes bacterium]|nr:hypothetical protein [Planctomycetota bacterium]
MVFSSITFLFLFLPLFLGLYFLFALPVIRKGKQASWTLVNLLVLGASLLFYTWGERLLVSIMIASTLIDYLCGLLIAGAAGKEWRKPVQCLVEGGSRNAVQKTALITSLSANLFFLCLFKYYGFFVDNIQSALYALGLHHGALESTVQIALPMGISFYTFQSMSYTIDVYRGRIKATKNLIDFACFVTLFPQLVAGPIVRYKEVAAQLVQRTLSVEGFSYGARRFMIGLGKKVLVADVLAVTADRIYALPLNQVTGGLCWLGTICFTLQLYFDFSGYSDMAIGLGRMLGFHFPENFNYPFIARSVREYWSRWHITLGAWFRDYLFFPLGGSRVGPARVYVNLFTVFFLCGLWHGASWTYVFWGLFHGLFLVLERMGLDGVLARTWRPWTHVYLILVNVFSKVIFRSGSLDQVWTFLTCMVGFNGIEGQKQPIAYYLNPELVVVLIVAVIGCTPFVPFVNRWLDRRLAGTGGFRIPGMGTALPTLRLAALFSVFALSLLWVANVTYNPFIY